MAERNKDPLKAPTTTVGGRRIKELLRSLVKRFELFTKIQELEAARGKGIINPDPKEETRDEDIRLKTLEEERKRKFDEDFDVRFRGFGDPTRDFTPLLDHFLESPGTLDEMPQPWPPSKRRRI